MGRLGCGACACQRSVGSVQCEGYMERGLSGRICLRGGGGDSCAKVATWQKGARHAAQCIVGVHACERARRRPKQHMHGRFMQGALRGACHQPLGPAHHGDLAPMAVVSGAVERGDCSAVRGDEAACAGDAVATVASVGTETDRIRHYNDGNPTTCTRG
jgi:hypothetical protein